MKLNHTPGPWAWNENKYTYKRGKRDVKHYPLLLQALDPSKPWRDAHDDAVFKICWPQKKNELLIFGLSKEDKKLMAAAPKMYEFLCSLYKSKPNKKVLSKLKELLQEIEL